MAETTALISIKTNADKKTSSKNRNSRSLRTRLQTSMPLLCSQASTQPTLETI